MQEGQTRTVRAAGRPVMIRSGKCCRGAPRRYRLRLENDADAPVPLWVDEKGMDLVLGSKVPRLPSVGFSHRRIRVRWRLAVSSLVRCRMG